ncbi:cellulose biosynthesis protein BcsE [Stutzerimonas stutzeri]|uniref:cellulose biosynthesis protein BcsE n=1 Tax=Stutzerimonas stutzeri TaxID=316 RepID=UPI000424787D|nr:cellulose biosynthesis protein BcsE [Stutzerimonas stutzeri]
MRPPKTAIGDALPTDSLSKQQPASLGLDGRDAGALVLNVGRMHWIIAEQAGDAALLSRQIIQRFTQDHLAVLVSADTNPEKVVANLAADVGPRELLLLSLTANHCNAFLKRAESELERAVDVRDRYILLALPSQAWAPFGKPAMASWLRRIGVWLAKRRATLVIVSDGICDGLSEHLNQLSCSLAGLASLNRTPSGPRLFLHFWHGSQGMMSAREVPLDQHEDGFKVSASSDIAPVMEYSDQGRVHAERSVLEAAPYSSAQWRLFESSHELLQHALTARAASVLFAISRNEQVDELAHQLNQLRRKCGNRLKLIVREIAPCLRYRDEQLLLSSGATLVVPFGTSLPRFLTLVESVQGHVWQRQLKDIDASLYGLKPLPICGQQSPLGFAEAVRSMWPDSVASGISHQLIRLQPVPGLSLSQVLSQTRLRRNGDIACIADKALYLFLFACRPESLDDALGNIFGVKWQELFLGLEEFSDLGFLLQPAFQSDIAPERDIPSPTSASAPRQVFKPRPLSLPLEARQ